jgi:hypothetical protein
LLQTVVDGWIVIYVYNNLDASQSSNEDGQPSTRIVLIPATLVLISAPFSPWKWTEPRPSTGAQSKSMHSIGLHDPVPLALDRRSSLHQAICRKLCRKLCTWLHALVQTLVANDRHRRLAMSLQGSTSSKTTTQPAPDVPCRVCSLAMK